MNPESPIIRHLFEQAESHYHRRVTRMQLKLRAVYFALFREEANAIASDTGVSREDAESIAADRLEFFWKQTRRLLHKVILAEKCTLAHNKQLILAWARKQGLR